VKVGKSVLVWRLALRDLRHNPAEAVLLLVAIAAAATTLTVALALHGVTSQPYAATRAATAGPDVVAAVQMTGPGGPPSQLTALEQAPGVTGWTGPYLLAFPTTFEVDGHDDPVLAEGRDTTPAGIDQPRVVAGRWVRNGGVVVERSLADLLELKVGQWVSLGANGQYGVGRGPGGMQRFQVTGIAVTAVIQPSSISTYMHPSGFPEPGLVWVTRSAAAQLANLEGGPFAYSLNLKLADPAAAPAFVTAHQPHLSVTQQSAGVSLISWQSMSAKESLIISVEQEILLTASSLLGLLALASVALLVGGRMEQQTRRVGLLKAVGATPKLVTAVLLAEQLVLALAASVVGLLVGWLTAPLLTNPGASLVGVPGAPTLDASTIGIVIAVAVAVAVIATFVPAIRAARASTVRALADAAASPRRGQLSIALSSRLPVPLLLGMRITSRRRRRALLSAASVAITVGALIAVLMFREHANSIEASGSSFRFSGPGDPLWERGMDVMLLFTLALVVLALVNAVLVAWATVQDARHTMAVERALGASPEQATLAVVFAQLISAIPGAVLGVPVGVGLYTAVGRHSSSVPSAIGIVAVVLLTLLAIAALTTIPASIGARRPVADVLQAETA
jgi:ABC-type lipoprotein release transport system permease subunit